MEDKNVINTLMSQKEYSDSTGLTLIEALDNVQAAACHSKLSEEFWDECDKEITYLRKRTGLNRRQIVILAILCEVGDGLTWRGLGQKLGLSRLKTMTLGPDVEDMKKRRWIVSHAIYERGGLFDGFRQVPGIIPAFRENKDFYPETLDGMTEQMFVERLARYVVKECADKNMPSEDKHWWMLHFVSCNPDLPLCKMVDRLEDEMSKIILLAMVADYANYGGARNEGLRICDIDELFSDSWELTSCLRSLQEDSQELICKGIIEHACMDGMADQELFRLTRKARENLLPEYVQVKRHSHGSKRINRKDLLKADSIKKKELFYDSDVKKQITNIEQILSREHFPKIQERLEGMGYNKGCSILFYGAPGTGKTETVLQLARRSRRDVMQVNIAGIRDKYVGETEKNIKGIFAVYKEMCKNCEQIPILLFNEADALINNRFEETKTSVEKMDNAMQNIILQEMENLEGILIATTNLTGTLDKAFDRRFLFKVEFNKPSREVKARIWHNKLPNLQADICGRLAEDFDFTGGQIENIARKAEIKFILSGKESTFSDLTEYCHEECINRHKVIKIGF